MTDIAVCQRKEYKMSWFLKDSVWVKHTMRADMHGAEYSVSGRDEAESPADAI